MKWIKNLDQLIKNEFESSSWADKLNTDSNAEIFQNKLIEKERDILIKGFEFLNFSVLEGEYIQNQNEFNEVYRGIHNRVANLQNAIISNDEDFHLSAVLNSSQFLYSLKKALEIYKRIADNINKKVGNPHKNIIIDVSDTFDGTSRYFFKKDDDSLEESLFGLFNVNLSLASTGFFLEKINSEFRDLLVCVDELKKLKTKINLSSTNYNQIIDLLIQISIFFQRKLIIRFSQEEKRFRDKYMYNQKEYDFSLTEHLIENRNFFFWDSYSQNHFLSENNKEKENNLRKDVEELINSDAKIDSFLTAHRFIKYYKDINPNIIKLEEVYNFYKNYNPVYDYDKFALNISKNYLKNNILSFKTKKINFEELDSIIIEYKDLQEKSAINNFFPYYKLCKYLKKYIQKSISNEKLIEAESIKNLNLAEKAINKLKICYRLYKENLEWSEYHLYFAYQMPFEESTIKIKIDEQISIDLFIASSFSIPIDYSKYHEFLKKLEYFVINSENEIKSLKNISYFTSNLISKEEEIKTELKDQSKRNIELLGIFSAIIALLYQGATAANSEISFSDKILTFFLMFITLISFLILLKSIVTKSYFKEKTFILLTIISLILISSIIIILIIIK